MSVEYDEILERTEVGRIVVSSSGMMLEYIESHSRLEDTSGEIVALVGFDYATTT